LTHPEENGKNEIRVTHLKVRNVDFALADLARITGAKRRSLQLWADAGVIVAESQTDRAGTGTHRRFSRDEAIVACIIRAFASHQIAIGELLDISRAVREFLERGVGRRFIEDAIKGDSRWGLMYESWKGGRGEVTLFKGQPEFKHLDKADGFAGLIRLKGYLSKIDE
jgi:DNA-binding transcriptional MerR regulator